MKITDIFIKHPVLSIALSLLILVMGIRSEFELPVREFPFTESAIITVVTSYTGADPEVIASFITTTLEGAISQSNGIDYMTSTSTQGVSTIEVYLRLNYDTDKAMTEITTYVNSVLSQLPAEAQAPQITVDVGEATDVMYIGFYSEVLPRNNISDYLLRIVQPRLRAVENVLDAEILGERQFALRAWLDPYKMAAYGLTSNDVANALISNNFLAAAGRIDGQMVTINLTVNSNLTSVEEFNNLVVKYQNGAIVRLSDVATVSLGAQNYDSAVSFDNTNAVYIGIQVVPGGNVLEVVNDVKDAFYDLEEDLPEGLNAKIIYDAADFINASVTEVLFALFEAFIIVSIVIFLFLGTLRSVIIPIVAIPLSLVGTFFIMFVFGYSINLLTLLALVLAIGLVVDDAIIIVENIHRHIKAGLSPFRAALVGARELANPIIAISVVLIAVYLPIGFMGGLTGTLFTEFVFTLAGAVAISAIIALTLSPMMCAKLLLPASDQEKKPFLTYIDRNFGKLQEYYRKELDKGLNNLNVIGVFAMLVIVSIIFLYSTSKSELAPDEDQGLILVDLTASPNASLYQTGLYSLDYFNRLSAFPEGENVYRMDGDAGLNGSKGTLNTSSGGMVLKPWDERKRTSNELMPLIQKQMDQIAGAKIAAYQPPPLPGTIGLPIQFVIMTTKSFDKLYESSLNFANKAKDTGLFSYIDSDLKLDTLQGTIELDRSKTAELGLTNEDVGNVIATALSENFLNYFDLDGRSYQVIPQTIRSDRINYDQILNYYISTASGDMIPLSTIATIKETVVPESLNHFQQLNAATISAVLHADVTMGTALETLEELAKAELPDDFETDYGGESRQYEKESENLLITFCFSMFIIYLALAALFESFRDPAIILISVPMSIFGALLFINLEVGGSSLNIFTEVGLVTLIGLISKHGILIVQFANSLQLQGKSKREAIIEAASIRLRPILMTTSAMVLGVIPLVFASGAGAESRFNIGLVIATGISIGTFFTLFVVPAMYMFLAKVHQREVEEPV